MKYRVFWGLLISISGLANATITVSFQPDTVTLGESTQLIFASDLPLTQLPDLSGLQEQFAVAGQQQRVQTVIVNGNRQTQNEFVLNVFPRKSGNLSTGSLSVGNETIEPAVLTVLESGSNADLPITLQASVNTSDVYPDETVLYTIKLTDGAGLISGQFKNPVLSNAQITPLDMDKTYQSYNDAGRPVQVFERTFAITPEKEGYLTVPPTEFYGTIAGSSTSAADLFMAGMLFDGLGTAQKDIRLETNPIQITVLNKPADWVGWWLPASQVSLSVQDTIPESVTVGDSLTRVIRLSALGAIAEKLPTITQTTNTGLKIYPSPEQRETIQTPVGDIQGVEELSLVIVPTEAGKLTIPAVRVPWFNIKTRRREEAVIPEKTITVTGGAASATSEEAVEEPVIPYRPVHKMVTQTQPIQPKETHPLSLWTFIFTGLGILGGFGLSYLFFRHRKHKIRNYRLPDETASQSHKKKKPLPDLYPF